MRVGILTYHAALNYGAVLQCYALRKAIEDLGNDSVVINYVDDNQEKNASMYRHGSGLRRLLVNLAFLPFHFARKTKMEHFDTFRRNNLNLTYRVKNKEELLELIRDLALDAVVVGSDQVWNPNVRDFTSSFFLPFDGDYKKIGYAVSLGDASIEQLKQYADLIDDFDSISVRESESAYGIQSYTSNLISTVVDPVFLLRPAQWRSIKSKKLCNEEDYLLCYFMNKKHIGKCMSIASGIAKRKGLTIKRINSAFSLQSLSKNVVLDAGLEDYLALIDGAACICTDSFHGTAFSIIFEKDFYSIDYVKQGADSRKRSLLEMLRLENRLVYTNSSALDTAPIDYAESSTKLESWVELSRNYLKKAISD